IRFRVVCGLGVTMASFSPMIRLSSVDLPTLGRPKIATVPATVPARGVSGPVWSPGSVRVVMRGLLYNADVVLSPRHAQFLCAGAAGAVGRPPPAGCGRRERTAPWHGG